MSLEKGFFQEKPKKAKKDIIVQSIALNNPKTDMIYCHFCGNEKGKLTESILKPCSLCVQGPECFKLLQLMLKTMYGDKTAKRELDQIGLKIAGGEIQRNDRKQRKKKRNMLKDSKPKAPKQKNHPKREIL